MDEHVGAKPEATNIGKNTLNIRMRVMVFNCTFNNFQLYRVVSFIGGGNWSIRRKSPICYKLLTTLVVIGTDCIGSNKSNYHTITTTTPHNMPCVEIVRL